MAVKDFLQKVFVGQKPEIKHVDVDPDSIKRDSFIKAQQNQIAELHGLLQKKQIEETAERVSEQDLSEETLVKEQLKEQEKELRRISAGKGFSLKTFFGAYFGLSKEAIENPKSKLSKALKLVTFCRDSDIAPFDDIVFSGNNICLTSKNRNVIIKGEKLQDIFQSPGALATDLASGIIPINLDKDMGYVENIMMWKPAEIIRTEDGIEYKTASRQPLYQMLQEKEDTISDLRDELEQEQLSNVGLQNKVNELQLANKVNTASVEIANNEKSKMVVKVTEIERSFIRLQQDLTRLQNLSIIDADSINKLQSQVDNLRKEAEKVGGTPAFNQALETIERIASTLTNRDILLKDKPENKEEK